jgi:hypothetical protein
MASSPDVPTVAPIPTRFRAAGWLACLAAVGGAVAPATAADGSFFHRRVMPVLDKHCVVCHGPEKQKAGLRVDSYEGLMKGAESGAVIKPGDAKESELLRRIKLPATDEEVMPSDGKPLLSADEVKVIELWIARGASSTQSASDFADAPALRAKTPSVALAPDWRPRAKEIAALETRLGVRLAPRSQNPTDGLVLRTASAPSRCDDAVLEQLAALAPLIVEAELARTRITDAGMKALARFENLRALDLTRVPVSSAGVAALVALKKLEVLNLTSTAVDDAAVDTLKQLPALKRLWLFGTKVSAPESATKVVTN